MWGIIPAAGMGSRIQPLAFSKELLPLGSNFEGDTERPKAVSEFLIDRMLLAGAKKLCFVIGPGKSDILQYYGSTLGSAHVAYVVQPKPGGLCDAIFKACPLIGKDEDVLVGLPDTIWFPEDGLAALGEGVLSFLLFPVDRPEQFDAVVTDEGGNVKEIQVKHPDARSNWIWGAFKMPGRVLHELHELWQERGRRDEYIGTLVNAYLERGGKATAVRRGEAYVDVGTLHGYREAIGLLSVRTQKERNSEMREPVAVAQEAKQQGGKSNSSTIMSTSNTLTRSGGNGSKLSQESVEQRVRELGNWFHNIDLNGVKTAPGHFLGDFPTVKWRRFEHAIPADLRGKSVLDIGCNGGFYSIEMKRRGAKRVVGIDFDDYYLNQARFAAQVLGQEIEFRKMSVYDVAALGEKFDLVLFMGILYHLRHPLLALDLIYEHVAKDLLVFQSLQRGSSEVDQLEDDYDFWETEIFDRPGYPRLYFVEKKYSHDQTNWWIPNRACSEAMLRSAGFEILSHPEEEVFVCRKLDMPADPDSPRVVYPARREGRHG